MKVRVIDELCQEVSKSYYTIITTSFEYHCASTQHLRCVNVLVYAARACDPVCMR